MNMKLSDKVLEKLPHELADHLTGVHYDNGLSRDPYNLETAVLKMGNEVFNLRHMTQGIHAFGSPGSGKSTYFISTVLAGLLQSELELGGVICIVKSDATSDALGHLEAAGASDRAYVMSEDSPFRFNIIDYVNKVWGGDERILADVISDVGQSIARYSGEQDTDNFWLAKAKSTIYNILTLLKHGRSGPNLVTGFEEIYRCLHSVPRDEREVASQAWRDGSYFFQLTSAADAKEYTSARDRNDWQKCRDFWQDDFLRIPEKTLYSVLTTLNLLLEGITRGVYFETFCTSTNITPDITFLEPEEYRAFCEEHGFTCILRHESGCGTVILDFSEKSHMEMGIAIQNLFRGIFQRRMEFRMQDTSKSHRPAYCICDEGHYLLTEYDYKFQSTARSARCIQIWASQVFENYVAALGEREKAKIIAFLSVFGTHVFMNNISLGDTNEMASTIIGKRWSAVPHSGTIGGRQTTGVSWQLVEKVEKTAFGLLKRPEPGHDLAEAIVYRNGAEFMSNYDPSSGQGENWLKVTFSRV